MSDAPAAGREANEGIGEDRLLGGRVRLLQRASGYRAAIDPVLLAAAVPARGRQRVLDLGVGNGAAALSLAARLPEIAVTGLELRGEAADLARRGAALNGWQNRITIIEGDVAAPPPALHPGAFDHVMANPPYLEAGRGNRPPEAGRAAAHVEGEADLARWIECGVAMVRRKGSVTLIHRADRLDRLLALMAGHLGEIVVFPLWPGRGPRPAKRVIVRGRKGVRAPLTLSPGLVLHRPDGSYTDEAEAVLRAAAPLSL
jgi:tRNA1(Val) A37 N6-methylase TrmN6